MAKETRGRRGGRPPKPPVPGERAILGLRVTAETKNLLDGAAKQSGRTQAQEAERLIGLGEQVERNFGGPVGDARVIAMFRHLVALIGDRDSRWLDDPVLFNTITNQWLEYLDSIRPKLSDADEAQLKQDYEELRRFVGEDPSKSRRQLVRRIAAGRALAPKWRARFARLAGDDEEDEDKEKMSRGLHDSA